MCKPNSSIIFDKMQALLPKNLLEKLVEETGAEDYTKKFTVLRQINAMMYAHIKEKKSLGDISAGIKAEQELQEYTGTISGSQLSRANRERTPELFRAVFEEMFKQVGRSSNGEILNIATNRFDLTAEEIADIYRLRWSIEVFFKWIKQHLKIKKFYGTSFNAILTQIYCALILYCLLIIINILFCNKEKFLEMTRLIAAGLFNTIEYLITCLTPTKTSAGRQKQYEWEDDFNVVLEAYGVADEFVK